MIHNMAQEPKFDYGDEVQVMAEEHEGRTGAVVGINGSESSRTYTVEFGDGSDSEIAEELLSKDEPSEETNS
jgi:ribosomal protein S4E